MGAARDFVCKFVARDSQVVSDGRSVNRHEGRFVIGVFGRRESVVLVACGERGRSSRVVVADGFVRVKFLCAVRVNVSDNFVRHVLEEEPAVVEVEEDIFSAFDDVEHRVVLKFNCVFRRIVEDDVVDLVLVEISREEGINKNVCTFAAAD